MLVLAALYVATSKFGFMMAYTAEQVTTVWPPTGISLAALLLFGFRLWPGIALGAFLTNYTANEPLATALGIAAGNTLEALAGAWMLRRFGFRNDLGRTTDVLALLIFSAILSTVISATIGVANLCLSGLQPWSAYPSLWLIWWVGDAAGALLVAPLLLAWGSKPRLAWQTDKAAEAMALAAGLTGVCAGIFTDPPILEIGGRAAVYLIFPFVIWTATRFGQRGTTLAILTVSGIAIWATTHHAGPFSGFAVERSLTALQIFMAVVAITGLFLNAAINERNEAEETKLLLAAAADRRKDEFLSTLAHELRNPLASIASAFHILQSPATTPPQRAEASAIMERQLRHITRLMDDLINIARISHGKIELRLESITVAAAVKAALETVTPSIEASGHVLSVSLPEEPLWLHADPVRLSQILTNLLGNAVKYTPHGGHIRLEAEAEDKTAIIRIQDTGVGIPPDMLSRIFDMFTQVENSVARSEGELGLGIGLALSKNLAEMHQGTIEARSRGTGRGSEFILRLPLAPPPHILLPAAEDPAPAAETPGFRVLVVDDNVSLGKTFGWMLEIMGHEVQVAHDGASALTAAAAFLPDMILLDIGLPGMDGYELCRAMRAMPPLADSIFVAQTGWGQPEHRARSKAAGFDHHLVKPVSTEMMEELFASLSLDRRQKQA